MIKTIGPRLWVHFAVAALLSTLGNQAVAAQSVRPGSDLPAALQGIQPAGSCRKDPALAPDGPAHTANAAAEPDLSCAMPAADLLAWLGRPATAVLDVRSAQDYEQAHIDGAMHMPMSGLGAPDFLRQRSLVLVGSGKAEREVYVACARLKARGFATVRVLQGGLAQWQAEGHRVLAREATPLRTTRLSTAELWAESQFDANLVLTTPAQARLRGQLRLAMAVPDAQPATLQSLLQRRRKELRNAPLAAVVLAVDPGTGEDALRRVQAAIAPVPLLVYALPFEQFSREMAQQKALWASHARGPKQPPCGL
jgi:rhodanese-related sulfurtransferase